MAVAASYGQHLGLTIARHIPVPAQTHFLTDDDWQPMLEIYCNPPDQVPDYAAMHPRLFHLAFVSESPTADSARLNAADASWVDEIHVPDASHLVMLRDPWGVALQLCNRMSPLV